MEDEEVTGRRSVQEGSNKYFTFIFLPTQLIPAGIVKAPQQQNPENSWVIQPQNAAKCKLFPKLNQGKNTRTMFEGCHFPRYNKKGKFQDTIYNLPTLIWL